MRCKAVTSSGRKGHCASNSKSHVLIASYFVRKGLVIMARHYVATKSCALLALHCCSAPYSNSVFIKVVSSYMKSARPIWTTPTGGLHVFSLYEVSQQADFIKISFHKVGRLLISCFRCMKLTRRLTYAQSQPENRLHDFSLQEVGRLADFVPSLH